MNRRRQRWRLRAIGVVVLLLSGGLLAHAQIERDRTLRIGYVDASQVLEQAPQAEQARKQLEIEFGLRDKALTDAQRRVRDLEEQLSGLAGATSLDEGERRQLEQQIRAEARDLERGRQEFREDFNIRRNEELRKLQRLVYDTIVDTAKREGYDLIVNDGAVIYAAPTVDLTEQVLEQLTGFIEQ